MNKQAVGEKHKKPGQIFGGHTIGAFPDFFCNNIGKFAVALQKLLTDLFISHHGIIKQGAGASGAGLRRNTEGKDF